MSDLPPAQILALEISNAVLRKFGFGPSMSISVPFAEQVIAEHQAFRGD
jgi:hypothetical protein